MSKNKEIGIKGELAATNYLIRSGYVIRERNYTFDRLEIDIIAEKENTLIFVEVKTRTSRLYGEPVEAVTPAKIDNILTCAEHYIDSINWEQPIRFDIISVYLNTGMQIRHLQDAFF